MKTYRLPKWPLIGLTASYACMMLSTHPLQASLDDLSDYSHFSTASDFADSYPAQDDQSNFPEFSWDTVPLWLLMRTDQVMTDASVQRVADNYELCVHEKYNSHGEAYTEDGIALISSRLKSKNPNFKNFFYWNSRVFWDSYRSDQEVYDNGYLQDPNASHKIFDHDVAGMIDWWVNSVVGWVQNDNNIDGVFIDASGTWYYGGIYDFDGNPKNDFVGKYDTLRQQLPDKLIVYNGVHNSQPNGNRQYLEIFDGCYRESSDENPNAVPAQSKADVYDVFIQLYREASSKGKITLWRGYADTTLSGETAPSVWGITETEIANREDFYERHVDFHLAMFLMMAEEYSYFGYAEGDYSGTGENGTGLWQKNRIWDTSYIEEFNKPLGPPLGPPTKNGYIYSRSFKYLDVTVNLQTTETTFNWKDPASITTIPIASITSPVHGGAAETNQVEIEAEASDLDGSIEKVEFFANDTKIGEDTTSPYAITWNDAPGGTYTLQAVATNDLGSTGVSTPITLHVAAYQSLEPIEGVTVAAAQPADPGSIQGTYVVREQENETVTTKHISAFFNFDLSGITSFDPSAGDFAVISVHRAQEENPGDAADLLVAQVTGGAWSSNNLPDYTWGTASPAPVGPGTQTREKTLIQEISSLKWETHTVDITEIVDAWINGGEPNYGLAIYLSDMGHQVGFGDVQIVGKWGGFNASKADVYQAEDALISSGSIKSDTAAQEGAYVDGNGGFNLTYTADTNAGLADLYFRVKVPNNTRSMGVFVNNVQVGAITTASKDWILQSVKAELLAGNNTIELRDSEGTSELDVDSLSIIPLNIAYSKNTAQSSTGYGGVSARAVDGDNSGLWGAGTVTHTTNFESTPTWWEVYLGNDIEIGEIKLWNRTDCCSTRLSDFYVTVYDSTGAVTWTEFISNTPNPAQSIYLPGIIGSTVRVELTNVGVALSLAEVQVYADSISSQIAVTEDSYTRGGGNGGNNYGTESVVQVKSSGSAAYTRRGYLKFPVSSAAGSNRVDLVLSVATLQNGNNPAVIELRELDDDTWSETGITWYNQPSDQGTVLESFNVTSSDIGGKLVIDVTDYVQAQEALDGTASFLLLQPSGNDNNVEFDAKDGNNGATLEVR